MNRTQLASVLVAAVLGSYALAVALIGGFGVVNEMERTQAAEHAKQNERNADAVVSVPVAVKDIPIGMKVTKEQVNEFYVRRPFPSAAVPPGAVLTLDELADKRTMRSIRQGELVMASDVNAGVICEPPTGTLLQTVPVAAGVAESGFLLPGYKVIVVAAKLSQAKGKEVVLPLALDLMVLGADSGKPDSGETHISFAVTPEQSILLSAAVEGGATIRVQLPQCGGFSAHETDTRIVRAQARSVDDLRAFLADD